jgi:5-methyltetrahydropteroyltriglutamate--homocysteine methyltransferase
MEITMKHSTERILSTHVGSLIRPPALQEFLRAQQAGKPIDRNAYERCLRSRRWLSGRPSPAST